MVVDASVALAWVLPGQRTAAASAIAAQTASLAAPSLFAYELRAGLLAAERRRQISRKDVDHEIAAVSALVGVALPPDASGFDDILALSRKTGLSFYDTSYLDLARRLGATLASRDGALLAATAKLGLAIVDAR